MNVEKLIRRYADALTHEASAIDTGAQLQRIYVALAEIPAPDSLTASEGLAGRFPAAGRPPAGRGPADPAAAALKGDDWPRDELAVELQEAEKGTPSSMRRVAELLELLGEDTESAAWWHRAAEAGDPDALLYIGEFQTR